MVARAVVLDSDVPGFGLALALTSCATSGLSPRWLRDTLKCPFTVARGDWLAGEAQHRCPLLGQWVARGSVHTSCCPSLQVVSPSPACHRGRD